MTSESKENAEKQCIAAKAYAMHSATQPFEPFDFTRREPGDDDVLIRIKFCGICHTDIHQAKNEWGRTKYPIVPGHEITGVVERLGSNVKKVKVGDHVGVGCVVNSCGQCKRCENHMEQHCPNTSYTYNGLESDRTTPTYGGYSNIITVTQKFVCRIPDNLPLDAAAPLLCAGITIYSPLKQYNVTKGSRLGVVGLGGLGHMVLKLGVAMGAEVTVISTSESKRGDAMNLGAKHFFVSKNPEDFTKASNSLDLIIDTVSAEHDITALLHLLDFEGVLCLVGASPQPLPVLPSPLISKRLTFSGSLIGGMKETQEMLDFCGQHNIVCDIEKIPMNSESLAVAYQRTIKSDVKYRFVLDVENAFK